MEISCFEKLMFKSEQSVKNLPSPTFITGYHPTPPFAFA